MNSTYERLIKSAIQIMNQNGYSGTSVQMIAEKVNVSKSTVIHYFKSKEGILLSILENFLPSLIAEFDDVLKDNHLDGVDKLKKFIFFHLNIIAEYGDILTLNIREARYLTSNGKVAIEKYQREYENILFKIINQIKLENTSLYENLDTVVVAKAVMGICNSPTIWYKKEGPFKITEIASQFFEILIPEEKLLKLNRLSRSRDILHGMGGIPSPPNF